MNEIGEEQEEAVRQQDFIRAHVLLEKWKELQEEVQRLDAQPNVVQEQVETLILFTIRIRFLDYIHRPSVLMKFMTFRRLALSPSSGEGRKGGFGLYCTRIEKVKVNKVKIGINYQSYTVGSLRMS
jgi:hypothetical protein